MSKHLFVVCGFSIILSVSYKYCVLIFMIKKGKYWIKDIGPFYFGSLMNRWIDFTSVHHGAANRALRSHYNSGKMREEG